MEDMLYFNGLDATTGKYLLPAISPELFSKRIQGIEPNEKEIIELKNWVHSQTKANMGLKEGDPSDLAQAGWGVVFPAESDPAVRAALGELLAWRQEQASKLHAHYYREFSGGAGYRPGESRLAWLGRHGMGTGPADPDKVPYYLLIVGDPDVISYRFQTQLDIQYATGRIYFDTPEEYANYAHSVVEAEKSQLARARRLTFFGVSNPDDPATNLSAAELVQPLAELTAREHKDWLVQAIQPEQATKQRLARLIGGEETPALLFSASHGMGFPNAHPMQFRKQGALVTQDWPGPLEFSGEIPEDYYFSADDLGEDARLFGMLAFFFACYGAGTPQLDEFAKTVSKDIQAELAPKAFMAALPRRMLAHPHGAALAVIGHVDRAWGYSFYSGSAKRQLAVFEATLNLLLKGFPIGAAVDPFNIRYAELSSELSTLIEDIEFGKRVDARELSGMWTANNDARNYVVIGDPAVRMMVAPPGVQAVERPELSGLAAPVAGVVSADIDTTMFMNSSEVLAALETLGRLYSVALDDSYPLPQLAKMVIGRRDPPSGNYPDIDLSDQGEVSASVSRRHAQISVQDKALTIEDLGSRNFTYVNGQKLEPGQRLILKNGDEIKIGAVHLIYLAY